MDLNERYTSYLEDYIEVGGICDLSSSLSFSEALKASHGRFIYVNVLVRSPKFAYSIRFDNQVNYLLFLKTYDNLTSPVVEKVRKPKIKVRLRKLYEKLVYKLKTG